MDKADELRVMLKLLKRQADRLLELVEDPRRLGPLPLPPDAERDARDLIRLIDLLDAGLVNGEDPWLIEAALRAGGLSERLDRCVEEVPAQRSIRALMKMRAGADRRAHPAAKIDEAVRLFRRLNQQRPNLKKAVLYERVRAATGVPGRTLRRHLKKRRIS